MQKLGVKGNQNFISSIERGLGRSVLVIVGCVGCVGRCVCVRVRVCWWQMLLVAASFPGLLCLLTASIVAAPFFVFARDVLGIARLSSQLS